MSISTTLTWSVTDTTRDTSDGFIIAAEVALTGIATITSDTPGGISTTKTHTINSRVGFGTTRTGSEIPYDSVTEANVVGWSTVAMGIGTVRHYETIIPRHLGLILDPPYVPPFGTTNGEATGTPW